MTEPQVTMSLSRFKELESAEQALKTLIEDKENYLVRMTYGQQLWACKKDSDNAFLIKELDRAIEMRDEAWKENKDLRRQIEFAEPKKRSWL